MDPTRRKWWIAGISLAVVAALALVAWRLTETGRLERTVTSRAAFERQLDEFVAADPYMTALKQHFPDDYARLRQAMLDDLKSARSLNDVESRAMQRARDQALRTAAHVAAAPDADLAAVVDAEQAVVRRLQAEDVRLCAEFGMTGLKPGTQTSAETRRLLSRAAEVRVKAARDGLDSPVARPAPNARDLEALRAAMLEAGASEDLAALILSPAARTAPPRDQCAGSVAFYDALAALPDAAAARWMSAITQQSARAAAA